MLSEDKVLGSLIVLSGFGGAKIDSCRSEIDGGGMSNGVANGDGRRKPILVLVNPK